MSTPRNTTCAWLLVLLCIAQSACFRANAIPPDCKEAWYTQRLDHFRWAHQFDQPTFQQRYFLCNAHWKPNGPIFFYAGNEGPLEGYLKSAGLMFESREQYGALVMFAEHRYYGKTQPFGPDSWRSDPSYLTSEQAMADYANMLWELKRTWNATDSPIIAFGGSYGGMLAAWMRRQYPHIVSGAVAASAPVGQFPGTPGFTPSAFWEVVTRDATPAGGAPEDCADNVREAFKQLFATGATPEGRQQLQQQCTLCDTLADEGAVKTLAYWVQGAFDAYAMGNYPFPSDYMTGAPGHNLPAWPMRAACKFMTLPPSANTADSPTGVDRLAHFRKSWSPAGKATVPGMSAPHASAGVESGILAPARRLLSSTKAASAGRANEDLVVSLCKAAGMLYNVTGDQSCFKLDLSGPAAGNTGPWDYQVCTEFLGQELPYFPAADSSMFWDQGPFDWEGLVAHCKDSWGVAPEKHWSVAQHGGLDWRGTSNIVFSNGLLDPWSVFGVLENVSASVVAVLIPDGAHHLDLVYSRPDDSDSLKAARATIMRHVDRWIQEFSQGTGS
eukprot:GHUV01001094.1.p1 GENE.GHUV01001094.1~~GHUV01001094.1.p1  ORF type:complete len:556 (+),score=121.02 GHUV01001094.1:559-2226(+)